MEIRRDRHVKVYVSSFHSGYATTVCMQDMESASDVPSSVARARRIDSCNQMHLCLQKATLLTQGQQREDRVPRPGIDL